MFLLLIQDFFHKKHARNKKERHLRRQGLQIAAFQQSFFPMLVETPYFGGVINPKTYLSHELGSNFFPLSSLTYLVSLLVFEKNLCKMSKN